KGDCRGVYVQDGLSGFDVVELQGGTSSVPLTYRVVAKRRGFEAKRLDVCEAARTDSYLYPELREKELQEDAAERAKMEERRVRQEDERVRMAQEDVRMREAPAAREALPEIGSRKLVAEGR
ncbi:MAG: hypothetical protein MUE60_15515, partial [Candidatus Eisenbacteria bacterium]|nr:hypothetical protein [Candidatus Eisenbacteria bacterium]